VGLLAWTSACRAEETGSNPVRGATGSEVMVTGEPPKLVSIRFDSVRARHGVLMKASDHPCKMAREGALPSHSTSCQELINHWPRLSVLERLHENAFARVRRRASALGMGCLRVRVPARAPPGTMVERQLCRAQCE
jgi:hypothetical protein